MSIDMSIDISPGPFAAVVLTLYTNVLGERLHRLPPLTPLGVVCALLTSFGSALLAARAVDADIYDPDSVDSISAACLRFGISIERMIDGLGDSSDDRVAKEELARIWATVDTEVRKSVVYDRD